MRHLTSRHVGSVIDQDMVLLLRALDRGVCSDRLCGGFRRVGSRQCNRCSATTRLRPPQVGDVVQGPPGAAVQGTQATDHSQGVSHATLPQTQTMEDVALPNDFTNRVRRLPPNTLVHIPVASRAKMASLTAECLEGMAANKAGWRLLEDPNFCLAVFLMGRMCQRSWPPDWHCSSAEPSRNS